MSAPAPHNAHRLGEKAIEAKGLVKRFKTGRTYVEVLKSVDFDACHGDVTMVMGPSGSGKSTLIAALSGLLKPDEGTVRALEADDLWRLSNGRIDRFRLDHCGFIFQGFNLFPALTARQQVMTALHYQGASKAEAHARAQAALEEVGLGGKVNQRPSEMSGGEKQRVAIARALAREPEVLLLDEVTSALDVTVQAAVLDTLLDLHERTGTTMVFVSHDLAVVGSIADRIAVLRNGRLVELGDADTVLASPADEYTASLVALARR
jgi:putative ABC transport system ATP-binding protein